MDTDPLEDQFNLPAADHTVTTSHHDWVPLKEVDGACCDRCSLTVSTTEFRLVRDGKCDDWPVTDA